MVSENEKELESMYGPAAPFSEHKRCDHITYTTAEGPPGVIVWCQAPAGELGVRYNVAPDVASGFVDFVVSGDVVAVQQEAPAMVRCVICLKSRPLA
jgi:hypothetical protein